MDANKRRRRLVELIKKIYHERRADDSHINSLLLLCFPLNGATKKETIEKSRDWCNVDLHKFFRHYQINIDTVGAFTESEIYNAEIGAVITIREHYGEVYAANQWLWLSREYNFKAALRTPFGNVYINSYEPPQRKPAERLVLLSDALKYLNVDEEELKKYAEDWIHYRHKVTGDIYFDADDILLLKRIFVDEDQEDFSLTGDAEIDEKIIYTMQVFNMF